MVVTAPAPYLLVVQSNREHDANDKAPNQIFLVHNQEHEFVHEGMAP